MAFGITGYLIEPPRVGAGNSPYTAGPDNVVSDQAAWNTAYPTSETNPAAAYMVIVTDEGDGKLPNARFGWTKNELIPRFDYDAMHGRFWPMPGSVPDTVGTLALDSNTARLSVPLLRTADTVACPVRLSLADLAGSGITWTVVVVPQDSNFTASPGPPVGTVELSLATGHLNWADADLVTWQGRTVQFQRQTPRAIGEVSGAIGKVEDILLMSPVPATGQTPLLRVGSRLWLTAVEVPNEAAFTVPVSGSFQWSLDTGRIKLSPVDVLGWAGSTVFMDGILLVSDLALPSYSLGTVGSPLPLPDVPSDGADFVVRATSGSDSYQFRYTTLVDSFSLVAPPDVQIRKADGVLAFNTLQVLVRAGWQLTAVVCDLPIEHGISLRLFRTPIDPQATTSVKDVAALYEATGATFASPIIGSPQVFLPASPLEDHPMIVKVLQGTGLFLSDDLPNLQQTSPAGSKVLGYLIDIEQGILQYAQRRNDYVITRPVAGGSAQLPDGFVQTFNRTLELEGNPNMGDWQPIDLTTDAYIEPLSGLVTFARTQGALLASGGDASISGTTLTSSSASFTTALVNKWLVLPTTGTVFGIEAVPTPTTLTLDASTTEPGPLEFQVRDSAEVLADRYFEEIILEDPNTWVERILSLGTITNSPRLTVPVEWVDRVRFRYASGTFSSVVTVVTGPFTNPMLMAAGTAEVDSATGECNFAQADVLAGGTVWWARRLRQSVDYKVTPELGFFEFTDRMMEGEQGLFHYKVSGSTDFITEQMRFLIRKELVAGRTTPESTVPFNPAGRPVADMPAPAVFRGGRPQTSSQVLINITSSTITFLPDAHLDGLLPHGAVLGVTENVYIDYYVLEAVGGEKTASTLQSPMDLARVGIQGGAASFQVTGDWTANFKPNRILRIDRGEVHLIQDVNHSSGVTTVTLSTGETFRDDWTAPAMAQASGTTRLSPLLFQPAYFTTDLGQFSPVPRGTNKVIFAGDRIGDIQAGTVLRITSGSDVELTLVTGSSYEASVDQTTVLLATNCLTQYIWGTVTLQRSVRPILEASATVVQTSRAPLPAGDPAIPLSMQNVQVFRKMDGQPGQLLTPYTDYLMEASGRLTFMSPLQPDEQWGIFYTGHDVIEAGRRVRASYVSIITPDFLNGLAGQSLVADYWLAAPDTFFYRVVKISEYRLELAAKYTKAATASLTSGGPRVSNASSPTLHEQGNASPYYDEGVYANDDVVTRYLLKFYNDLTNILEDVLQDMDGRIVGSYDGRFVFDGNIDNPKRPTLPTLPFVWADVTNQVDDLIKIADAPYQISFAFPNFSITPLGTYVAAYTPSAYSRFFPTWRRRYGVTGAGVQTGDPVMDTGSTNLTSVQNLRTRLAWAQVTQGASAGSTVVFVDNAQGSEELARPAFRDGMEVVIQRLDGSYVVQAADHIAINAGGVAVDSLTLNAPVPLNVPVGATIYRSPIDPSGATDAEKLFYYQYGKDYLFNPQTGQILYVVPFPPLDGSIPLIPAELYVKPLPPATPLSLEVTLTTTALMPEKIPALYGGTTDDDGEQRLPLIGPDLVCEAVTLGNVTPQTYGLLPSEQDTIGPAGPLDSITTTPVERSACSLDVTRTIITLGSPLPTAPSQYDLVRIINGLNGPSAYYRIATATNNDITVEAPFPLHDSGFTCVICTSPALGASTGTFLLDTLTDLGATFQTWGVQPGHTVVVETGAQAGRRLQVVQVIDENNLRFEVAFIGPGVPGQYRITDCLASFGTFSGGSLLDTLVSQVAQEVQLLLSRTVPINAETLALEDFFDLAFTYLVSSSGGSFSLGGTTFTDLSVDFVAAGVAVGDVIYIRSGLTIMGVYQVNDVSSPTTLEVDQPFGDTAVGVAYKVGKLYGVSFGSVQVLMGVLQAVDQLVMQTLSWLSLLTTPVGTVISGGGSDPYAFTRGTRAQDLTARRAVLTTRVMDMSDPTGTKEMVVQVLVSDFLYDKRYTWLDARINRQTGVLTQKALAVTQRLLAQELTVQQLTKLASMGSL